MHAGKENLDANNKRKTSLLIHNTAVKARTAAITIRDAARNSAFHPAKLQQHAVLRLPFYLCDHRDSFPQTAST